MGEQEHDWLQEGHPPVSQKMRKSTARRRKKDSRSVGAYGLQQVFQQASPPPSDAVAGPAEQDNGDQNIKEAGYALGAIPLRPAHGAASTPSAPSDPPSNVGPEDPSGAAKAASARIDAPTNGAIKPETAALGEAAATAFGTSDQGGEITVWKYSNEARVHHSKYAELSQAYDDKRYAYCREGCLNLLTEAHLPRYTRIQTLQLVSTIVAPEHAEAFLEEAETILSEMDHSKFQVQLLKEDNEKMKQDLAVWRGDGSLDPYEPTKEWEERHKKIVQEREDVHTDKEKDSVLAAGPERYEGHVVIEGPDSQQEESSASSPKDSAMSEASVYSQGSPTDSHIPDKGQLEETLPEEVLPL